MDNLNIKRLEQLRATFDDVRLSRLLQEYEEKCAANIVAMLGALNDRDAIRRNAHELRGMSAQFGFENLSSTLGEIEAVEHNDVDLLATIASLCTVLKQSLREAREHLHR